MHMVYREEKEEEKNIKKAQSFLLFHNSLLVNFLPTNPKKCSLYKFCIKIKNFKAAIFVLDKHMLQLYSD